jgi:hypothetical protein
MIVHMARDAIARPGLTAAFSRAPVTNSVTLTTSVTRTRVRGAEYVSCPCDGHGVCYEIRREANDGSPWTAQPRRSFGCKILPIRVRVVHELPEVRTFKPETVLAVAARHRCAGVSGGLARSIDGATG